MVHRIPGNAPEHFVRRFELDDGEHPTVMQEPLLYQIDFPREGKLNMVRWNSTHEAGLHARNDRAHAGISGGNWKKGQPRFPRPPFLHGQIDLIVEIYSSFFLVSI